MTKQEKVFDIINKFEFFQGQRAGRELWNDKPKEVQDKDIADFIKDINYIRSYLQDSVVLSREEYEKLKRIEAEKDRLYEIKLDLENQLIEKGWTDYEGADEIEKRVSKETAEKILNDLVKNCQYTFNIDGKPIVELDGDFVLNAAKSYGIKIKE